MDEVRALRGFGAEFTPEAGAQFTPFFSYKSDERDCSRLLKGKGQKKPAKPATVTFDFLRSQNAAADLARKLRPVSS